MDPRGSRYDGDSIGETVAIDDARRLAEASIERETRYSTFSDNNRAP